MSGFEKIAASSAATTAIPGALFDLTPSEARVELAAPLAGLPKILLR
jgi:hypothetical protein